MPFDANSIAVPGTAQSRAGVLRRVIVVAPHFEEYAYRLARGLSERCDVVLALDLGALRSEFEKRTLPGAPRVSLRNNRFRSLPDLVRLIVEIVRFRPQVIHWQEPSGLVKAVIAAIVVTLFRPFVTLALTVHDPVPHDGRDAAVARRLALFRRYTRRKVHRILVHGPSCREQYLQAYLPYPHSEERIALTDHGVILADGIDMPPTEPFSVLMFGRMESYKGLAVLCDAIDILSAEGCDLRLQLAGAGPEIDALEPRFTRHPAVSVDKRFVAAADLITMIQASDCVVLPYTGATQSGVLAAAFGNGRFVVASRIGGIADIVEHGENGLLVPPGDAKSLARALQRVATDKVLRGRLQEGARRTAAEQLSWSRIAADLVSRYAVEERR